MPDLPTSSSPRLLTLLNRPAVIAVLALLLLTGISLTAYRTYRQYSTPTGTFDWTNRGHSDFHNGSYYPSMAFRDGVNPYATAAVEQYPLTRSSPIYSPVVFIWHTPFTFLSLAQSDVAFFVFNTVLLGLLAWLGIRFSSQKFSMAVWLLLFSLLVFSRPGHITLFTGYFTLELVIGSAVALHFARTRPFVSGCGMLLASGKPTYILPLTFLMLCRRNVKAVVAGLALCTVGGLVGLGWLAWHSSVGEVISGINEGRQALHEDPTEDPVNTWTRLDTVGVVAKVIDWKPNDAIYLVSMLVMLAVPGWAIFRLAPRERNHGATGLTALIVSLTMIVSIYHHSYDSLLIVVSWIGLALYASIDRTLMPGWIRWATVGLLAVPAANYLSTQSVGERLGLDPQGAAWEVIASANGVCLLVALCLAVWCAFRADNPARADA